MKITLTEEQIKMLEAWAQEMLEWVRATLPMDLDFPQMIERKIESLLEKEKEQNPPEEKE